jgi:uncharacterized protein (TIGR02391 family)
MRDLGFDQELLSKCSQDLSDARYREAVNNGFYVLEGRIRRESMAKANVGGKALVEHAFNYDSGQIPVGIDPGEKEGVYFLFRGAFQAFRNPAAHRDVLGDASRSSAVSQLALVNLLLALTRQGKEQFERGVG